MAKATIVIAVENPDEVQAVTAWFGRWKSRFKVVSEDYGCGCCVNIWDVEGPAEAFGELPEVVVSGLMTDSKDLEEDAPADQPRY